MAKRRQAKQDYDQAAEDSDAEFVSQLYHNGNGARMYLNGAAHAAPVRAGHMRAGQWLADSAFRSPS